MEQLLLIFGGVLLSLAFIALVRWLYPRHELTLYGIALIPTAGTYVFFALINGAIGALPRELLGVLLYGSLGLAGVWRYPVLIAFGWTAHIAWDLAVAGESAAFYAPAWWPSFCVGTDLFLAGYITAIAWRR
jgi:hypothetical protein